MAYNESLAQRVRDFFQAARVRVEEKKMMGGLCFMVDGKMCVGVEQERLMARIGPEAYEAALRRKGCTPMDFTGRPLRGFVFVGLEALRTAAELKSWLALALAFNPSAQASRSRSGQARSSRLGLSAKRMQQTHLLGIEIGGTKLQIVAGTVTAGTRPRARILETRRFTVDRAEGARGIRGVIESALPELITRWTPAGVGVGFGGPVDTAQGRIARSHQIEGWSGFRLRQWLERRTGRPVWVENDANTAALAEAAQGAGSRRNPVFYVTLGSGVGGGCVLDGRIYHGQAPGESEIGHVRLDRDGTLVEQRCSGWAVDARIRRLKRTREKTVLRGKLPARPGGEAKLLIPALRAGDRAARRILDETAADLAFALSHVTHLFHPEVVVLGGGLSLMGEPLRAAVAKALPRFVMEVFHGGPEIRLARLGEQAVPIGALLGAAAFSARRA